MSVQAMSWVLEDCPSEVGSAARMVLISIANHADARGGNSWPGMDTIARESGLSSRQAQRWVRWLEDHDVIAVEERAGGDRDTRGDRRPNRYRILPMTPPRPPADDVSLTSPRSRQPAAIPATTVVHSPDIDDVSHTSPRDATGCHPGSNGVTSEVERGDVHVTRTVLNRPEPSSSSSTSDPRPPVVDDDDDQEQPDHRPDPRLDGLEHDAAQVRLRTQTAAGFPVHSPGSWLVKTAATFAADPDFAGEARRLLAEHPTLTRSELAEVLADPDSTLIADLRRRREADCDQCGRDGDPPGMTRTADGLLAWCPTCRPPQVDQADGDWSTDPTLEAVS